MCVAFPVQALTAVGTSEHAYDPLGNAVEVIFDVGKVLVTLGTDGVVVLAGDDDRAGRVQVLNGLGITCTVGLGLFGGIAHDG